MYNSIVMSTINIGSLSLVILQDLSKFEAPENYQYFIGSEIQQLLSTQISNKSVLRGFLFENK